MRVEPRKTGHISVIIAIGANLPGLSGQSALATCQWAAREMARLPGLGGATLSRWFDSAAEPAGSGPRFVNGALRLHGTADPAQLLGALHRIEYAAGRARPAPNAPRTLDLDIIDIDGLRRAAPDPVLPHPRAHGRAFVLLPLRDVAPAWVHPTLGLTVGELLARLPPHDTRPLTPSLCLAQFMGDH